jgi:hypothetical protein
MIKVSSEVIWHFTCDKCLGWFSIASHSTYAPKKLYCPHCGERHEDFKIINELTGKLKDGIN